MIEIERTLRKIVSNFWFEWNSDVHMLFRSINLYSWSLFKRNLYRFLKIQDENPLEFRRRLSELLTNPEFLTLMTKVEKDYKDYMRAEKTIVSVKYPELAQQNVAYFSMEYGIDILKIYSGGLGILSGDHLRGASDLGLKMTGVGLFYLHGYYEQKVKNGGEMKVVYDPIVPPAKRVRDFLPLEQVKKAGTTEDLIVKVKMPGRDVFLRVWKAKVGRVDLFLLDSDLRENKVHDRHITRRLYASQKQHEQERKRRLEQEIVLGIGGVKALEGAGVTDAVYHLNEGHVTFASLEIMRRLIKKQGLTFAEVQKRLAELVGFTTHTPVPEGNERFDEGLVRHYLSDYLDTFLTLNERETIFNCARNREDQFDMTKLSMMLSGYRNGVSALHGEVSRKMWGYAWGNFDPDGKNVAIDSITNAVHAPYWQKPKLRSLIESSGGVEKVMQIPDDKIWELHLEFKTKLIEKVRERLAHQLLHESVDPAVIASKVQSLLSVDSFMIGFARRFADYKRVTMLVDDEERLFTFMEKIYKRYGKPIHILYAGKPHPNNTSGRDRIRQITQASDRLEQRAKERGFQAQLIFIEGYDIDLARYLEAGVEVWLNNPIRPQEASGTSGMKAGMNGVLNVSVSDGWVPEGVVNGENGWLFGKGDYASTEADRDELFNLLENKILPIYFERKNQQEIFSRSWLDMMKNSIMTITRKFNTDRMLCEYVEKMYLPSARARQKYANLSKV